MNEGGRLEQTSLGDRPRQVSKGRLTGPLGSGRQRRDEGRERGGCRCGHAHAGGRPPGSAVPLTTQTAASERGPWFPRTGWTISSLKISLQSSTE